MSNSALKISDLINDPKIHVKDNEDLNIERNMCNLLIKSLTVTDGNKVAAARKLQISERSIFRLIREFHILFDTETNSYVSLNLSELNERFVQVINIHKSNRAKETVSGFHQKKLKQTA